MLDSDVYFFFVVFLLFFLPWASSFNVENTISKGSKIRYFMWGCFVDRLIDGNLHKNHTCSTMAFTKTL